MKIDGKLLNKFSFTDDVVLIGKTKKELQNTVQDFEQRSEEAILECERSRKRH